MILNNTFIDDYPLNGHILVRYENGHIVSVRNIYENEHVASFNALIDFEKLASYKIVSPEGKAL